MSGKKLSSGTLGLRFMQNALRAREEEQIEVEQAKVKDDGEWEVSKEVREGWGINSGLDSRQSVTYEQSYIPFLFPMSDSADDTVLSSSSYTAFSKGRRSFNSKGKEVKAEAEQPVDISPEARPFPAASESPKRRKPLSISASASVSSKITQAAAGKQDASKNARNIISDISGVGVDLRSSKSRPPPVGFLKPAGVDEPAGLSNSLSGTASGQSSAEDKPVSTGDRMQGHESKKKKRARESIAEHSTRSTKKPKQKPKTSDG